MALHLTSASHQFHLLLPLLLPLSAPTPPKIMLNTVCCCCCRLISPSRLVPLHPPPLYATLYPSVCLSPSHCRPLSLLLLLCSSRSTRLPSHPKEELIR